MLKVVMTSYVPEGYGIDHPRAQYASRCVNDLYWHLYGPEKLELVIANDGPHDQPHIDMLREQLLDTDWSTSAAHGPRRGIGGSLNRAMNLVGRDDLWMYTTDDWRLVLPYDVTQAVRLIREAGYHYVRLGPPHPNVYCKLRFTQALDWWFDLFPSQGGYVFATRPFIADRWFYDRVGPFKELCNAYDAERDYSDRVNAIGDDLNMAEIVHSSLEGPWEHIGKHEVGEHFP